MPIKQVCCSDILISGSKQDQTSGSNKRMMQIDDIICLPVYVSGSLEVQYSSQESGTVVWKIY